MGEVHEEGKCNNEVLVSQKKIFGWQQDNYYICNGLIRPLVTR